MEIKPGGVVCAENPRDLAHLETPLRPVPGPVAVREASRLNARKTPNSARISAAAREMKSPLSQLLPVVLPTVALTTA
jgi:hypothetical protein